MSSGGPPRVAVVLTTYNEEDSVAAAIRGVQRQTYPVSLIVVVDGGSEDGTRDVIDRMRSQIDIPIVVQVEEDGGLRYACQVGAEQAATYFRESGEADDGVVVSTDGDSVLATDFVEEAVRYLRHPEYVCYGAQVRPKEPETVPGLKKAFQFIQNLDRNPKGRGIGFWASDFLAVDGYYLEGEDEAEMRSASLDAFEDVILRNKLRERGRIHFSDTTCVYSEVPSTSVTSVDRWKKRLKLETEMPGLAIDRPLRRVPGPATVFERATGVSGDQGRTVTGRVRDALDAIVSAREMGTYRGEDGG